MIRSVKAECLIMSDDFELSSSDNQFSDALKYAPHDLRDPMDVDPTVIKFKKSEQGQNS